MKIIQQKCKYFVFFYLDLHFWGIEQNDLTCDEKYSDKNRNKNKTCPYEDNKTDSQKPEIDQKMM